MSGEEVRSILAFSAMPCIVTEMLEPLHSAGSKHRVA